MDFNAVRDTLLAVAGVEAVHSLHIWALTAAQPLLSVHIAISECHSPWKTMGREEFRVHPHPDTPHSLQTQVPVHRRCWRRPAPGCRAPSASTPPPSRWRASPRRCGTAGSASPPVTEHHLPQPCRVPGGTFHGQKIKWSKGLGVCRGHVGSDGARAVSQVSAAGMDPQLRRLESSSWRPAALVLPICIQPGGKPAGKSLFPSLGTATCQWGAGVAAGEPIPARGREDALTLLSPLITPLFALGKPKDSPSPQGWGLRQGGCRWQKHQCTKPLVLPVLPTGAHCPTFYSHHWTLPLHPPLLYW